MVKYYCPFDGNELVYFGEMNYYYCPVCDNVFDEEEVEIVED